MRQKQRDEIAERLKLVRALLGHEQPTELWRAYLSDLMTADHYRKIERAERGLQADHADLLAGRALVPGLTKEWLLMGSGEGPSLGAPAQPEEEVLPLTLARWRQAEMWVDELLRLNDRSARSEDARLEAIWRIAGLLIRENVPVEEVAAHAREYVTSSYFHDVLQPLTVRFPPRPQVSRR